MIASSWLSRSGQAWKMRVFYGLVFISLSLIGLFIASVNHVEIIPGISQFWLAMLFMGSGFGGFGWLVYAIRCPRCGYRPVMQVLKRASVGTWLSALLTMTECPSCHQEP